jgi:two-component system CheB/CheR fusion protein
VKIAFSGADALSIAPAFHPSVVFLDIGMPVMDGYEVARRLRQMNSLPKVRLVALSGYGSDNERRRSLDGDFDAHLVKPIDTDAILDALRHDRTSQRRR